MTVSRPRLWLLLWAFAIGCNLQVLAFTTTTVTRRNRPILHVTALQLSQKQQQQQQQEQVEEIHPAVQGWPEKYTGTVIGNDADDDSSDTRVGPRMLHSTFTVEQATPELKQQLDVERWPTWTTADKPKWVVGKQNVDKIMPYGELSLVLQGALEITITNDNDDEEQVVIVREGDFVTFPKDFKASWRVLEELTWHYYLY